MVRCSLFAQEHGRKYNESDLQMDASFKRAIEEYRKQKQIVADEFAQTAAAGRRKSSSFCTVSQACSAIDWYSSKKRKITPEKNINNQRKQIVADELAKIQRNKEKSGGRKYKWTIATQECRKQRYNLLRTNLPRFAQSGEQILRMEKEVYACFDQSLFAYLSIMLPLCESCTGARQFVHGTKSQQTWSDRIFVVGIVVRTRWSDFIRVCQYCWERADLTVFLFVGIVLCH